MAIPKLLVAESPERTAPLSVLLVERHRFVAQCLSRLVANLGGAEITAQAHTRAEALAVIAKASPDVAIVDLDITPDAGLIEAMRELSPDTRIVVLADRTGGDNRGLVRALAAGATGAIYKEDSLEDLSRALSISTRNTPVLAEAAAGVLLQSYLDALAEKQARVVATIEALASAVEVRDHVTGSHLHRVTELASACMELIDPDLASNDELRFGFTLHDVGKIGVPDAILNKPQRLTADEWTIMKRHPEMGAKIVEPIGLSVHTTEIILAHHERWNGSGYPFGVKGLDIPLSARVFAVADSYDAMTSDRPYRAAMPRSHAVAEIVAQAGTAYDPDVVDAFLSILPSD